VRLEVDLEALAANWRVFARLGAAEAAAVVKADGYGLGADACAKALAAAGARTFFTATLQEAKAVRAALGPAPRIATLNPLPPDRLVEAAAHGLTPVLNSLEEAAAWKAAGPGSGAIVHLDTGMNRLGAPRETWGALADMVPNPWLAMSHLACADAPDDPMNPRQPARFSARISRSTCCAPASGSMAATRAPSRPSPASPRRSSRSGRSPRARP
jgi:alanine racemase